MKTMWECKIISAYRQWFFDNEKYFRNLDDFFSAVDSEALDHISELGDSFKILSDLGREGWELVHIVSHPRLLDLDFYIFKRAKEGEYG